MSMSRMSFVVRCLVGVLMFIGVHGAFAWGAYVDHGDGTVTDTTTQLMWQKSDDGSGRNWQDALAYCENLDMSGHTDWRLPNVRELESLVDLNRWNPSIDPVFDCRSSSYWSGSTYAYGPYDAWVVGFGSGYVSYGYKTSSLYVRCVREGPSGSFGSLTIAQQPMSGPPGTVFTQWGTGFTPNSSATLHFRKPDGSEYPTLQQPIDGIGHFEVTYTAPLDKPPGTYTWWGIDGVTGAKSNEVSYVIEGVAGEVHHFSITQGGEPIADQTAGTAFFVRIEALDYGGNLVTSFNDTVYLSLAGPGSIEPTHVRLSGGRMIIFEALIAEPVTKTRVHCYAGSKTGDSNDFAVNDPANRVGWIESWVVDRNGRTPLAGATVNLSREPFGSVAETKVTNHVGIYRFDDLKPGRYYVWASYDERGSVSAMVDVSPGIASHPSKLVVHSKLRPVILVPGIMGSDEEGRNSVYPSLPKEFPAPQDQLELHDPGWKVGWHSLQEELEDHYEPIKCPYDWRASLSDDRENTYKKYLLKKIDEAKNNTGWEKVDVVAHSMGGLLVRSYIQSEDYRNDIEKFVMVGTPNRGSLRAYAIWEGGNPMLADLIAGSSCSETLGMFYSNTADNVYEEMTDNDMFRNLTPDCPGKMLITVKDARKFLFDHVPSLLDLMPVFDKCLLKGGVSLDIENKANKNRWLIVMNSGMWLDRIQTGGPVETRIFASKEVDTLRRIEVVDCPEEGLYEDGVYVRTDKIEGVEGGDGTVPGESSALLPNVPATVDPSGGEHAYLIKHFKREIVSFLDQGRTFDGPAKTSKPRTDEVEPPSSINLSMRGRPGVLITDAGGARCGVDDDLQAIFYEIPGCDTVRDPKGGGATITSPATGAYEVKLSGSSSGAGFMNLGYMSTEQSEDHKFAVYYPGSVVTFDFALKETGDPRIELQSKPPQPQSPHASPYSLNSLELTQLNWEAVSAEHLAGYRIYTRRDDELNLVLLTAVGADTTQYATDHPWEEPLRIYSISAFDEEGKESFLSSFVKNRLPLLADFTGSPLTGTGSLNVQFTDTSSGLVTSWLWDFGDGATSTDPSPLHNYEAPGSYTVRLGVSSEAGEDVAIKPGFVTVNDPAPVADFSATPTTGSAPLTVAFTDLSQGDITSRSWDFGDGGTSTEQSPSHTYETANSYTVTLAVEGPGGSSIEAKTGYIVVSEATGSLVVTISPPAAVDAGAQWKVDTGEWQAGGATVPELKVGSHTVTFKPVTGWTTPGSKTVTIIEGETTTETGTYTVEGQCSVSEGVSVSADPVTLDRSFAVSFGLKETKGGPRTFEEIAVVIQDAGGSDLFDFYVFQNITISANGTWRQTATNLIRSSAYSPGTFKAILKGRSKGSQRFIFDTVASGVNPMSFTAEANAATPAISQSPLAGKPGDTFFRSGSGFSPSSTAVIHVKKPNGTEYPVGSQAIDNEGSFSISYKAPSDTAPGTYTWWAIDGPSGEKSNEITYTIASAAPKPGAVLATPSRNWTTSPHEIKFSSKNAEKICVVYKRAYGGKVPPDPPMPTLQNSDIYEGDSSSFAYYIYNGEYSMVKVRFRGYNNQGYGPVSPVYRYSIDLRGKRLGSVSGALYKGSVHGAPLSGARVECGGKTGATLSSGSFSITDIKPGKRTLRFSKPGYESKSVHVTIKADANIKVKDQFLVKRNTSEAVHGEGSAGEGVESTREEDATDGNSDDSLWE